VAPGPEPGNAEPAAVELLERLRGRADAGGFVPFDRFMDLALYDPRAGFYSRDSATLGSAGDYYTAPHVHPLFASALAARIRALVESIRDEGPVRVVEIGPGDGALAEGLLRSLGGGSRLDEYLLVERSDPLARRALARASPAGEAAGIPVRRTASIAAEGPVAGVVIANELIDAMPARRLRWNRDRWNELGVRVGPEGVEPAELPLSDPVPPPPLPERPEAGTIVEFSSGGEAIVREVADHLTAGAFVLIDYGMSQAELLAAHPRGTLEAIRRHRSVPDPLAAPGETDLSVFVNFDRLRAAANSAGWVELAYRSQAEALGAWGFPEQFQEALARTRSSEEEVRLRLAAKSLLFGFERFRVLELGVAGDGRASTLSASTTARP
jgi:SAM-dependent MidA family methyltransferase